jgi:type VI secretion system secreted protein VgrG
VNVGAELNYAVGGLFSGQVAGARVEVVGAAREETVDKDSAAQVGGDFETDVKGQVWLSTGTDHKDDVGGKLELETKEPAAWIAKEMKLEADKLSIVVDGKLALSLDNSGNLTFGVSSLSVDGSKLTLKGAQVKKVASSSAASKSVSVQQLQQLQDPKKVVRVSFQGADGHPALAGVSFELKLPDGSKKAGKVGGDGVVAVGGVDPGSCQLSFPDIEKPHR